MLCPACHSSKGNTTKASSQAQQSAHRLGYGIRRNRMNGNRSRSMLVPSLPCRPVSVLTLVLTLVLTIVLTWCRAAARTECIPSCLPLCLHSCLPGAASSCQDLVYGCAGLGKTTACQSPKFEILFSKMEVMVSDISTDNKHEEGPAAAGSMLRPRFSSPKSFENAQTLDPGASRGHICPHVAPWSRRAVRSGTFWGKSVAPRVLFKIHGLA